MRKVVLCRTEGMERTLFVFVQGCGSSVKVGESYAPAVAARLHWPAFPRLLPSTALLCLLRRTRRA